MERTVYRRTQFGTAIVAIVLGVLTIDIVFDAKNPSRRFGLAGAIAALTGCVFSTMTIAVTDDHVEWWLTFGLFRQRLRLSAIDKTSAERVSPLNGLGIRTDGRNWLWIVTGRDVVACHLRDGRRIALGSPDAAHLASVINERLPSARLGAGISE